MKDAADRDEDMCDREEDGCAGISEYQILWHSHTHWVNFVLW